MPERIEKYIDRVQSLMPELEVHSAELNDDGLMNVALIVNKEFVFRFAKHEHAVSAMASEAKILQLLDGRLSLLIPHPLHIGKDVLVNRYIEGEALTRTAFFKAGEIARNRMAGSPRPATPKSIIPRMPASSSQWKTW